MRRKTVFVCISILVFFLFLILYILLSHMLKVCPKTKFQVFVRLSISYIQAF